MNPTHQPGHLPGHVPGGSYDRDPYLVDHSRPEPRESLLDRLTGAGRRARIRRVEGPRGSATRQSIYLRYAAYALVVFACCSLTQAALNAAGTTRAGGVFMLFAATLMGVTAAGGSALYPTHRENIIEEFRHYLFGLCVYPATGVALVIWAIQSMLVSPNAGSDTMTQLLSFSVPVIFVCTLIIPPVIFVKQVAGAQTLHRSTMDDEEMVAIYTRQDSHQR